MADIRQDRHQAARCLLTTQGMFVLNNGGAGGGAQWTLPTLRTHTPKSGEWLLHSVASLWWGCLCNGREAETVAVTAPY